MKQRALRRRLLLPLVLLLLLTLPLCAFADTGRAGELTPKETEEGGLAGYRYSDTKPTEPENPTLQVNVQVDTPIQQKTEKKFPLVPVLAVVLLVAGGGAVAAAVVMHNKSKAAVGASANQPLQNMVTEPVRPKPEKKVEKPLPPPPPKRYFLCVEGGPLDGREYPVTESAMLIGRSSASNIRFPADTPGISGQHCQVMLQNGSPVLVDLKSRFGTTVQGNAAVPEKPTPLHDGDVILLGGKSNKIVLRAK